MPRVEARTTRILRRTTAAPYRKPLRIFGVDAIPIHKTCFPLQCCLSNINRGMDEDVQFTEAMDIVPIHRQNFPLCENSDGITEALVDDCDTSESDFECESTQELLYRPTNLSLCDNSPRGRIRSRQIRIPLHDGSAQKSEDAQSSTTVDGSLLSPTKALTTSFLGASQPPLQHERKIRNVDLITFWFVSRGPGPIEEPLRSGVRFTDLYLHLHGESEVQVWIWNSNNVWETVEQGYVHPQLPDRRLWLASRDEPSWITRKTARTYKGKAQAV